jgi:VanZ family protein
VREAHGFLFYWLPVFLWMALIFGASSDSHSFQHSASVVLPILKWLFPGLSDEAGIRIITFARKCAHLTEYAILGLLVWRALRRPVRNDPRPWRWSQAGVTVLIAALYASTDEFHQRFVPTRHASPVDVCIDTCGAAAALLLLWLIGRWRKHW